MCRMEHVHEDQPSRDEDRAAQHNFRFDRDAASWHPYRVRREPGRGQPLTVKQQTILAALAHRCPRPGDEIGARTLAADTGLRLGSLVLSLRHLAGRRLVIEHPATADNEEPAYSPSLLGRARIKESPGPALTPRRPA